MRKKSLSFILIFAAGAASFAQTPKSSVQKLNPPVKKRDAAISKTAPAASPSDASIATPANLKIAFIGDVGVGANQRAVLSLIKAEGAQAVLHQGDFDYHNDPAAFWSSVDSVLGASFPYFVSVGNHDVDKWPTTTTPSYAGKQLERFSRMGLTPDSLELNNQMYAVTFQGLKVVFVGEQNGVGDAVYAPFIRAQFKSDSHIWKLCSWHKNMNAMQVGDKTDDMGWGVYEACREAGAIIATGHEHSYERTKTLSRFSDQTVDPDYPDPNRLAVGPGRTFAFVSGLGGESIRPQKRCWPVDAPYGCKGEWAKIYTSNQHAQYGVLFVIFHVNGDANKAHGYFKTVSGQVVDEFDVAKVAGGPPLASGTKR
jgi:hypothetical protein